MRQHPRCDGQLLNSEGAVGTVSCNAMQYEGGLRCQRGQYEVHSYCTRSKVKSGGKSHLASPANQKQALHQDAWGATQDDLAWPEAGSLSNQALLLALGSM